MACRILYYQYDYRVNVNIANFLSCCNRSNYYQSYENNRCTNWDDVFLEQFNVRNVNFTDCSKSMAIYVKFSCVVRVFYFGVILDFICRYWNRIVGNQWFFK